MEFYLASAERISCDPTRVEAQMQGKNPPRFLQCEGLEVPSRDCTGIDQFSAERDVRSERMNVLWGSQGRLGEDVFLRNMRVSLQWLFKLAFKENSNSPYYSRKVWN